MRDGTGELTGIGPDVARLEDKLTHMVRNNVFPEPAISFQSTEIDHRTVLAMYVNPGAGAIYGIHQTNTLYFVRRGATTFPARPEELTRIIAARLATNTLPYHS